MFGLGFGGLALRGILLQALDYRGLYKCTVFLGILLYGVSATGVALCKCL